MDYDAEDKAIFEKITTDALRRVMSVCEEDQITGHLSFSRASKDDIRLAVDGADIMARRSDFLRPRFLSIRAALMNSANTQEHRQ